MKRLNLSEMEELVERALFAEAGERERVLMILEEQIRQRDVEPDPQELALLLGLRGRLREAIKHS